MQAAREARRKARILAAMDDRLAVVSGAGPRLGKEKRLVLDDEEIDPALTLKRDTISADPVPVAALAASSVVDSSNQSNENVADLLSSSLDEVFAIKVIPVQLC